jgi:predicted site-specific integrase-resolvase
MLDTATAQLLTETETANLLRVKPKTLQEWRRRGHSLRYVRISAGCIRYRLGDVIHFQESRLRRSTSDTGTAAAA